MVNKEMFTIIVPNFNNEMYILETLKSIKSQTLPAKIIVIDDSSTDNSVQVAKDFLVNSDVHYQLIVHQVNQGISRTLNEAISKVDTEYYFILSSDDYLFHNQVIEFLVEFIKKNNYPDVIMSAIMKSSDEWVKNAKPGVAQVSQWMKRLQSNFGNAATLENYPELLKMSHLMRFFKTDFIRIHNYIYDEDLTVGEDVLFKYKLLLAGANVGFFDYHWLYYRIDNAHNTVSNIETDYKKHGEHILRMIKVTPVAKFTELEMFFVQYIKQNSVYIQNNVGDDSKKLYELMGMYRKIYKKLSGQVKKSRRKLN